MPVKTIDIPARGLRFDALVSGPEHGELVLLLHGFPQTARCWNAALRSLGAAGYRAVAVNQRGYTAGARPTAVSAYSVDELSADIVAIAEALGRSSFHLVGHDWGGTVAWAVAGDHPDAVTTLTAVSTPHSAALREALRGTRQRLRMSYIPLLRLPHAGEALFDVAGGVAVESLLVASGLSRAHARRDVTAIRRLGASGPLNWYRALGTGRTHLATVPAPVLHLWGDRDVAFAREGIELTASRCTGSYHLVELTGAGHWIPDEHWSEVDDLVLDHLRVHPIPTG